MNIAVDIPPYFPSSWRTAAGALEYSLTPHGKENRVSILLPHSPTARVEDRDPANWDAVINVRSRQDIDIPQVCVSSANIDGQAGATIDENMVVKMAVDQFVSIGLGNLAFFGPPHDIPIRELRWRYFSKHVEQLGSIPLFVSARDPEETLAQIRKPCGILAMNDEQATLLLLACARLGIRVPGDVYVICIGNAPCCLETTPTLSSISLPYTLQGYHAARLGAQLINGETVESVQLPPQGLFLRDSSKVESDDMETVSKIAQYLRMNFSYPIQMEDLARRSGYSSQHLARIFSSRFGMAPIAFLKDYRLEQAKRLLRSGDMLVREIADTCGYRDANHLCRIFRERVDMTPTVYRETYQEVS